MFLPQRRIWYNGILLANPDRHPEEDQINQEVAWRNFVAVTLVS